MTDGVDGTILVVNSGSSSVRFALLDLVADKPLRVWQGALERIGLNEGRSGAMDIHRKTLVDETRALPNRLGALELPLSWVESGTSGKGLIGVGHRVVRGGADCDCSLLATPALEARPKRLIALAPLHLPHCRPSNG